ncbi:glycosyltransferase family 1 protein [Psychroserpens burtonensis]|uniref:Glycosyltransferase family 1 protein n=1 Tax=Psychroserpens burtonensis TaxID=49278 RepID=A0A5C7BHF1_9FLAO|nr:glycosyltransferase [Psychroserpens burtonensis]TXE19083.1 glycosyltransferase family 1 protein [Psychroserpens burtonensis]
MNKIKVVHILNSVGGVDVSLRIILKNIDNQNFENVVIHGLEDTNTEFKDKDGKIIKEYKIPIQRNISPLKDSSSISKAIKILRKEKPDIIHAHSAKGGIIAKIATTFLKIPVLHTPQAYSFMSGQSKIKKTIFLSIEKMFVGPNNKILASSTSEQNRAINEVGYPIEQALLFNNSIKPISTIQSLSIDKTWPDNYICSVGRPSYQKNIELMLDVLNKIRKSISDIHLVLMGVGFHSPNLETVKKKIRVLNLESNITLLEWTTREDIFNIIKKSQLYLTTARYEGLPYAVIESLALSKPIVATDADGNRDLVIDNFNGRLIFNEDVKELSQSVVGIINSEEQKQMFSINSLKMFNENFNIINNIGNLENIYRNNVKLKK